MALAAEALKNLGFDVAKPDRHVARAVASFGLVPFHNWPDRDGRTAPSFSSKSSYLAVMQAIQDLATAAGMSVVLVDIAIWHTHASRALALREGLPIIGRLLGHRRVDTTARYAHLTRDSVRESAERIAISIAPDIL